MMIGYIVKTLRREQRLLFGEVSGNGHGIRERFGHRETVVKSPEKIRRHYPMERVQITPEQGARERLEEFITFIGGRSHDFHAGGG
jgi:hypothetical protein